MNPLEKKIIEHYKSKIDAINTKKIILETYEDYEYLRVLDQLIEDISESHDFFVEDKTIGEILEDLSSLDLSENILYKYLIERSTPAQRMAARMRSKKQKKSPRFNPNREKPKTTPRDNSKEPQREDPKREDPKREDPKREDPKREEPKEEPKDDNKSSQIEKLSKEIIGLEDQIRTITKKAESIDGKSDPKAAMKLDVSKIELQSQKDLILSKKKALEGDSEDSQKYKELSKLRSSRVENLNNLIKLKESDSEESNNKTEELKIRLKDEKDKLSISKLLGRETEKILDVIKDLESKLPKDETPEGDKKSDETPEGDKKSDETPEGEGDKKSEEDPEGEGDKKSEEDPEGEGDKKSEEDPEGEGDKKSEEDPGDPEKIEKNKDKIEALEEEIKSLEKKFDQIKKLSEESQKASEEKTNSIVGDNSALKSLSVQKRLDNKIKYYKQITSIIQNNEDKQKFNDIIEKSRESAKKIESSLEDAQKKADETHGDDPKYQEALKSSKKDEESSSIVGGEEDKKSSKEDEKGEKPIISGTEDPKAKDDEGPVISGTDTEKEENLKKDNLKDKVEVLKKAVDDKKKEIEGVEDEDKKNELKTQLENIIDNFDKAKKELEDLDSKPNESSDNQYWLSMVILSNIQKQIDELFF